MSGGVRASAAAARRRALALLAPLRRRLDAEDERAFGESIDRSLEALLPVLGPAFGLVVVLFGFWDVWIDPVPAGPTLQVRLALVLAGALGYGRFPLGWTVFARCVLVYGTHAGAMVAAAAMLDGGLALALPGIAASMFPLALVEPRPRRCLAAILPPALLLAALAAWTLPPKLVVNSLFLFALALALACAVAQTQGRLRREAFLAQKALLHAWRHDSLSGAMSRSYLTETAMRDLILARRHGRPLAVAMLDIDHFKRVNDCYGHEAGDAAIRVLVATCNAAMRGSDYVGRIGGEEFVCVMPETDAAEALACAERIRALVEAQRLPVAGGTLRFTVSLGVCVLDARHPDWDALLREADGALYQAKSGGRNRVVLAAPSGPVFPAENS